MMHKENVKIFKLNSYDWYAAEDMESAIKQITNDTGNTSEDCVESSAHELTDDEMDSLKFVDYTDSPTMTRTFREQLALMIERGDSFPCLFATTEF